MYCSHTMLLSILFKCVHYVLQTVTFGDNCSFINLVIPSLANYTIFVLMKKFWNPMYILGNFQYKLTIYFSTSPRKYRKIPRIPDTRVFREGICLVYPIRDIPNNQN